MSATHPAPLRDQLLSDGLPAYVEHAGSYARLRGKSRQTGKNWNDAGLIVWVQDDAAPHDPSARLVNVAASDSARAELQNPLKRQAPAPGAQPSFIIEHPRPASTPPARDQEPAASLDRSPAGSAHTPQPAPGSAPAHAASSDTQLLRASVQKVEGQDLDNALKRVRLAKAMGELVSADQRREAETRRMRRLRDRLLALPVALAEDLNPANPTHAQAVLRRELRLALEALADDLAADARRAYGADASDDHDDDDTADTAQAENQPALELIHA